MMVSPRKPTHSSSHFSGSMSPLSPAKLIAPTGDDTPRAPSRNLGKTTYTSQKSHMSKNNSGYSASMDINKFIGGRGESRAADDNTENRFELFLLGDGEKKVTEEADTRIPSSSIFTFNKEDHTLGNMLRSRLLQSPHVTFAGYKVPHPLVSQFLLRIQTDGTLTPRAALMQTCKDLVSDLSILSREFTKEWELRKMVGDGAKADDKKGDKDKNGGK